MVASGNNDNLSSVQSDPVQSSEQLSHSSWWKKIKDFQRRSPLGSSLALIGIAILFLGLVTSVGLVLNNKADNRSHASGTITLSIDPKPQIDLSNRTITFFVHLTPSGDNPPQVAAAKLHMLISSKLLPLARDSGLNLPTGDLLSFVSFTLHNPHAFPLESESPSGIVPFSEASPSATPPPGCRYSWTECPRIACISGSPCPTCEPKPTLVCTTAYPSKIPTPTPTSCIPVSSCIYGNPGCVVPLPPLGKTYCPLPTPVPPTPSCTLVAYGNEAFCEISCKGYQDTTTCPKGWGCFDSSPGVSGVCVPNPVTPTPTPSCFPIVCPSGQHCQLPAVMVGGRRFCFVTPTPTPNKVLGVQDNQEPVFASGKDSAHLYYSVGDQYTKTVSSDSILANITFHLAFPFPDKPFLEQKDIDTYAKILLHNFNLHIAFASDTEVYTLNQSGDPRSPFVKAQFTSQPLDVSWESIFGNITPTPTPPTGCHFEDGVCSRACVYGKSCPPCPTPHLVCTTPTPFITPIMCHGDNIHVNDCPEGYACQLQVASALGGYCIKVSPTPTPTLAPNNLLRVILACIDLDHPMSDPNSNYNSLACKQYSNRAQADLNHDGWINGVDLNIYLRSQGRF